MAAETAALEDELRQQQTLRSEVEMYSEKIADIKAKISRAEVSLSLSLFFYI